MDNFHQGGKYSAQIASHQAALIREGNFTDQKSLSISSLQTDYLNLDRKSGCGKNSEGEKFVQKNCTFCGGDNHSAEKNPEGSERKKKNLVRLVICTKKVRNARLPNVLEAGLKMT